MRSGSEKLAHQGITHRTGISLVSPKMKFWKAPMIDTVDTLAADFAGEVIVRLVELKTKYDPTNFFSGNQHTKTAR
jgi:hypothetical protein